jgi:hypothetical protein
MMSACSDASVSVLVEASIELFHHGFAERVMPAYEPLPTEALPTKPRKPSSPSGW